MANITEMLNLNNAGSSSQLSATGAVVGGGIGALVGQPIVGAAIGSGIGSVVSSFIPQYTHVRGSVSGINFVTLGLKPYSIKLFQPDDQEAKNISDYYCYFGCRTSRSEALNIPSYMYENHAYVKGTLHYNSSIPIDKFQKIQEIFSRGVHIVDT